MCFKCGRIEGLCNCIRQDGGFEPTTSDRSEEQQIDFKCRLSCCKCSYCHRVTTKERCKSQYMSIVHRNKICEKCFLCRSITFCKACHQCPTCCFRSPCRGEVKPVLAEMGNPGFKSKSGKHTEGGLHSPLPVQTPLDKVTDCNKQLPQSNQTVLPYRGTVSADKQKCSRTGGQSKFIAVLQPAIFGTQTQQPVETHPRPEHLEHLFKHRVVQDGDPRDHKNLPPSRGVGHIHRFQRCILPYTHSQSVQEVHAFSPPGSVLSVQALPFGLSTAPMEFTVVAKEVKLMALQKGIRIHQYLDDWLVRASTLHTCLQHTQTLVTLCQELGWLVNKEKSELAPKQVFNFVGYQFDLKEGKVRPTEERWQALTDKIRSMMSDPVCPVRKFMSLIGLLTATEKQVHLGRLHMRPIQWHLKNNWRVPESLEKVIPVPKSLHPHLRWWLEESNVLLGQPLHPLKHALQIFTDASNEGWGAHLDDHTARGTWSLPESKLHINHLELKAVFLALKEFQTLVCNKTVLIATDNTTVVAYINKEGGMKSGSLCALLWRILSWCTRQQVTLRARHIPGRLNVIADKLSRLGQTIQTEWSLHPAVFQAVCARWHQPQVDLFATRFNNKLPQFVSLVPDPQAWAVDALSLSWEDLDPYAFPPAAILGKVVEKLQDYPCNRIILIAPGWPNMPWFWDLVAMSSQIPLCLPNLVSQPFNQVLHRNLSNLNLHAWLLEPQQSRSKAFSEAVAARIEAPQRRSTRSVYEAKWTIFTKWCLSNQVDFRAPPLKAIADFLLRLFQDKKLQPGTIDGYRSAIADKLGNSTINVSKDENLTRLLDSFHRDRPRGRRGIPSWNLSLVLHQLTKAPFEPLKESSLKHLTFKTVFLLALGSGKRRSEIHAWLHKNIRHQSDWSKVSLYPSPGFLSKNQLAKEGPDSVAPVVIPALAPSLDRSLKGDRSLCPVRALRYYLDRTADPRQNKELVFVSFKKGFDKDISPATISSWIKQTVVLCYELSDQEALTLHQVKAHDVRAFAASKAFQSGISLDQILSACHWKSHNTFTQFYLKDVAWADSELFHLGPVVAAQQVHHQAQK